MMADPQHADKAGKPAGMRLMETIGEGFVHAHQIG